MKKLTSTLALLAVVLLASCSKEGNGTTTNPPAPKTQLELLTDGTWDMQSLHHQLLVNDSIMEDEVEAMTGKVTFLTNGTVIASFAGEGNDTSAYVLKGTDLTIDDITFEVSKLNSSELVMRDEESETDPSTGMKMTYVTVLSFKK